jgi:hypothetical protein
MPIEGSQRRDTSEMINRAFMKTVFLYICGRGEIFWAERKRIQKNKKKSLMTVIEARFSQERPSSCERHHKEVPSSMG